jgi:hypothetical protein
MLDISPSPLLNDPLSPYSTGPFCVADSDSQFLLFSFVWHNGKTPRLLDI